MDASHRPPPSKNTSHAGPPASRRGGPPSGPTSSRDRDPLQERGAGFVWLLAPHPGRIRAIPVATGGTLGRDEDATLKIDAPGVAPNHARVDLVAKAPGGPAEIYVTDAGTTAGTYVSGMRAQRTVLHDGDLLRVGSAIALVVEREVGSYDGNVIDELGIIRGPRSRRGWYAAVERALAEPKDGRRVAMIIGPQGAGRRTVARRIASAWGAPPADEGVLAGEIDVSALSQDSLDDAIARAAATGCVLVRGAARLASALQVHLARSLSTRASQVPTFAIFEESPSALAAELVAHLGLHRIEIPSIEQRREEIPAMIKWRFEKKGVTSNRLSIELYEAMTRAAWPGEVSEIIEVIDRIAGAHPDVPRLGPEHLVRPLSRRGGRIVARPAEPDPTSDADRIRAALVEAKGSVAAAARALHLSRQALYREAARLGIDIRRTRDEGTAA
jgi:hypothetical protein